MLFAKKHKQQVESKAESCSLCKLTKFVPHLSEKDVTWVNKDKEIDNAQDMEVNFSFQKIENEKAALTTTKDVAEIKVNQIVTIRGLLLFGEKKPEQVQYCAKVMQTKFDEHCDVSANLNDILFETRYRTIFQDIYCFSYERNIVSALRYIVPA